MTLHVTNIHTFFDGFAAFSINPQDTHSPSWWEILETTYIKLAIPPLPPIRDVRPGGRCDDAYRIQSLCQGMCRDLQRIIQIISRAQSGTVSKVSTCFTPGAEGKGTGSSSEQNKASPIDIFLRTLKEPSHQIRYTWRWCGSIDLG